jgi:hypothetical protein
MNAERWLVREKDIIEKCAGIIAANLKPTHGQSGQRRANGHSSPFTVTRALSVRGQRAQASSAVARD